MGLFDNLKPKVPENPTPGSEAASQLSGQDLTRAATDGPRGGLQKAVENASQSGGDNIAKTNGRRPGQGFRQVRRNASGR
ncbi:hypothetical protein ACFOVU_02580 [Nocardiopsis sediminis]|uniref:Antitoxin n=1 Tax=Nocardiopsis sediminis TaxID=1778267 RepID=A0ABV8FIH7_9ACTN